MTKQNNSTVPENLDGDTNDNPEIPRIEEAYLRMANEAGWRRLGRNLFGGELADQGIHRDEARQYADEFIREENRGVFHIGCSGWETNRALVYVIEAARRLCGVDTATALKLLRMAIAEVEDVIAPDRHAKTLGQVIEEAGGIDKFWDRPKSRPNDA